MVGSGRAWASRLIDLWWVRLPLASRRLNQFLFLVLSDGLYVCAAPAVAAFGPPAFLLVGILIGRLHVSFSAETFTSSLLFTGFVVLVGGLSAGMATWLTVGYAF